METGKSFFTLSSWFLIAAFLVVGLSGETCNAKCTSSYGNIPNISFPFRLKHDPKHCGDLLFTLSCVNNRTLLDLSPSGKYYVQAINYDNQTIRVVDPGIQKNNCSFIPRYPLAASFLFQNMGPNLQYYPSSMTATFLKCASPVNSPLYVDTAPCLNMSSSSQQKTHGYVMIDWTNASDFTIWCTVEWTTAMLDSYKHQLHNASYEYIHNSLLYGFDVAYYLNYRWCTSGWGADYTFFHHTISGFFGYVGLSIIGDDDGFSIEMYHNGELRGSYYVNGYVDWFDYCDKEKISMTEIDGMVKELGYEGIINYWYNIPGSHFDCGPVKLSEDYNKGMSRQQMYRAKDKAFKLIEGSFNEQYSRVWDYYEELRKTNPRMTAVVKCDFQEQCGQPQFQRFYACLGATKEDFKAGCRPIIGLDGCFLKSVYARKLLIVVGIDANNETWVFAYAIVESECNDSWIWFLELLVKDCEIVNQCGFTFIFDKQRGLFPAFEQVVPNCDHRFFARHLLTNYRILFKAKSLRDNFWEASYATTIPYLTRAREELKKLSKDVYEWLTTLDKPPRHWSKSHFNTHLKCDMLLNNLCESFNGTVLDCRGRPILIMFEYIRCKLMWRIHGRNDKMQKWNNPICPRIFKNVEANKSLAGACVEMWSGGGKFQVSAGGHAQYIVDLELSSCSFRAWDLQGWPCVHAISAINSKEGLNVMNFVDECYFTQTYLKIYDNRILPLNGMNMWDKTDFPPCLPPSYSKQPGRPRKCRKKEEGEHKGKMKMGESRNQVETTFSCIPKTHDSLKCGQCGKKGHNRRTCHRNLPSKEKIATKRKMSTENTESTIDPSQSATSDGPSKAKKRSKPPRRVQKGKPVPKPSKKGHTTSEAPPASTSCTRASTCA